MYVYVYVYTYLFPHTGTDNFLYREVRRSMSSWVTYIYFQSNITYVEAKIRKLRLLTDVFVSNSSAESSLGTKVCD